MAAAAEEKSNEQVAQIPSSARVWESAVIPKDKDSVFSVLKACTFAYNTTVKSAEVVGDANAVGSTRVITYADGTKQTLKILELSDLSRTVTWILVASEPALSDPLTSRS